LGKTIEVGLPISRIEGNDAWREDLIAATAGNFDYVVPHHYCHLYEDDGSSIEDNILGKNYWALDRALDINQILDDVVPGQNAYQYDSEWAPIYHETSGETGGASVRTGNIYGTLHSAVRLIYYAKGDFVKAASAWTALGKKTTTMGHSFLPLYDLTGSGRTYNYWLYYYFNRHLGDDILDITGTVPYYTPQLGSLSEFAGPEVPMLVTKTGNKIYIVAANGSRTQDETATFNLSNFTVNSAVGVRMTNNDIDAHPLIATKSTVVNNFTVNVSNNTVTFPMQKHSIVFITLTQ
jgi:alpha-L-arabinofuranosidase